MPQVRARTIGEDRTDSDVIMGAPTRKLSELTLVDTTLKKEILGAGIDEEARCDAAQPAARGDPVQANDLYVRVFSSLVASISLCVLSRTTHQR